MRGGFSRSILSALALWLALFGLTASAQTYTFSTFAGAVPSEGGFDGTGSTAHFNRPRSIAVDTFGNVYIADTGNHTIRKMTPSGVVTTLAGTAGVAGSADGSRATARFNSPQGIAVDFAGNVYVADTGNSSIRKISFDGSVTTFAGLSLSPGSADGGLANARFNNPRGLALDTQGALYVADTGNHTIRKITLAGNVVTLAGKPGTSGSADGSGTAATFLDPTGIVVDRTGLIYVGDDGNQLVRKVTDSGVVTTLAGHTGGGLGNQNGSGSTASFSGPLGLTVDSLGNIYVADSGDHSVRLITPAGVVSTLAGSAGTVVAGSTDSFGTSARFNGPSGIAIDLSGYIYVADTLNNLIRRIDPSTLVTTLAGSTGVISDGADGTGTNARFNAPRGIATDIDGNVYVADTGNHTVRKISPDGVVTTVAGAAGVSGSADGTGSLARFNSPQAVAVDSSGSIYVADTGNHTIRKITSSGTVTTFAGSATASGSSDGSATSARFSSPVGLAVDNAGNVYVADGGGVSTSTFNNTIRKITPAGVVSTLAGQAGTHGFTDGTGPSARFSLPNGLAVDATGNLYVADGSQSAVAGQPTNQSSTLRKITSDGVVTTFAGFPGVTGSSDGTGVAARFNNPQGVTIDYAGNLYVADTDSRTVRRVATDGTVTTVGGLAGATGAADGGGSTARFSQPYGIAIDGSRNIYVVDTASNTIRKGTPLPEAGSTARLINLSVLGNISAAQPIVVGFVIKGGNKSVLIRAIGPGLSPFLGGTLAGDPRLDLYHDTALIQSNDNWGGSSALSTVFSSVGAFSLPANSVDSAILTTLADGSYTSYFTAKTDGAGLIEMYDADSAAAPGRLINISCRYRVSSSNNGSLVLGFVLHGTGQRTVLIRGVGPTLASTFHMLNTLADPKLEVYKDQQKVAQNNTWPSFLAPASSAAGAFGLVGGSKDAVLVLTLDEGAYTAILSGADNGSGEGMIEIYELN
jgi:sugar lactone lactonase YvrE